LPTPAGAEAPAGDTLEAELALVNEAQRVLASDPKRALALAEEHAKRFPDGALAQEREVVAISALLALGRRDAAVSRGAKFAATWPRSAHLVRISAMTGDAQ